MLLTSSTDDPDVGSHAEHYARLLAPFYPLGRVRPLAIVLDARASEEEAGTNCISLSICICVCVSVYVYIEMYIYIYVCVCVYRTIYICIYICVCVRALRPPPRPLLPAG